MTTNFCNQTLVALPLASARRTYGLFLQSRCAELGWGLDGEGSFFYVPPHTQLAEPIVCTGRVHLYLGQGAVATARQEGEAMIDLFLDQGASCTLTGATALQAKLKRDSRLVSLCWSAASLRVQLVGENAEVLLAGLVQLRRDEQCTITSCLEHAAPHTRSRQHFKSVVRDQAAFAFQGKILVQAVAQKTESYQLNQNLCLSAEARARSEPNLEIFADDVKASHGSTTGQLDEEALFYLRARGLPLEEARNQLIDAFCREIFDYA